MTFTDLLIIYLAFGAPLAVYKYLQNRASVLSRRVFISAVTFFFWIPAAVEIGYLYLTNAYSLGGFVSRPNLDSPEDDLTHLRESVSAELIRVTRNRSLHDVRETVDRYVGLADAIRNGTGRDGHAAIFAAAGRKNDRLARRCLMRRNLRRLERHHTQARQDFISLFEQSSDHVPARRAVGFAITLARKLGDNPMVDRLTALEPTRGEIWNTEQQHHAQTAVTTSPIAMIAPLKND